MGKTGSPRSGSMQFWPRVRASKSYARIRSTPSSNDAKPLVFAGYKAGMTHVIAIDADKNSMTKGEQISIPVTVIECPPLKIHSVRFYKPHGYGIAVAQELFFKSDKEFLRKTYTAKKLSSAEDVEKVDLTGVSNITIQVYTQPKKLGFSKKKPEVFEINLGGSNENKINFIKEQIGKEIAVSDVLAQGDLVDVRAVTKGKGFQGPVKRFGIGLRSHKSEKTKRGPGSLGGWIAQGHTMYRIAHAGQMGYHQRTQYNNVVLSISDDVKLVNPKGGFINYGEVKNTYVLVRGSVPGSKKRLVALTAAHRSPKKKALPTIQNISIESKQGN